MCNGCLEFLKENFLMIQELENMKRTSETMKTETGKVNTMR